MSTPFCVIALWGMIKEGRLQEKNYPVQPSKAIGTLEFANVPGGVTALWKGGLYSSRQEKGNRDWAGWQDS